MSKSNRKINSNDVQSILGKNGAIRLPLFIKKNNDEGMDFYYMGGVSPKLNQIEETTMGSDSGKQVSVVKIRFNLANPVSTSMYNYLEENGIVKDNNTKKKDGIVQVQNTINFEQIFINPIPLYNFYAAAGTFSEMQSEKDFTLIEGPENIKQNNDYFACKIVGESMNRTIPNGSICLFKPYTGGSRNGKIVLVENFDIQDQDFNSAFTIKTYSSEKIVTEEGWEHNSIVLRPNSFDTSYKNIIINEENGEKMRVVGEFVKILH
jgi:SOS-response transcriptional repressor LexA